LSCIRCGDATEESAYLCESCADTCFQDPLFFFPPTIIGESLVERLRHEASALIRLGPTTGGDIDSVEGQSFHETVSAFDVKKAIEKEAKSYYEVANFVLSQYGVPLYSDQPKLSLTEEGSRVVAEIAHKVNTLSSQYPKLINSDIFLRMGLIYWSASRSVLMRAAPVRWCREKRKFALLRSLEFLGRIPRRDDLYSLAMKMSGLILLDAGAFEYAEEKLSRARKSFPDDMVLVRALAKTHFHMGNVDEAISLLELAISVSESADAWFEKGEYLKKLERYEEAISAYEEAVLIDKNYIKGYKALIHLLRNMGQEDEATRREADLKIALEPGAAAKLEELLQAEEMILPEESAAKAKRQPLMEKRRPRIKREHISDPIKEANRALSLGDFDTAIEILRMRLTEKKGADPATLILLTRAYLYNGQFEQANRVVGQLLKKDRDSAAGWYWKAKVDFAQGRWGAAIQHLDRAARLLPSFVDAFAEKGLIFLANQRYKEAEQAFAEALTHDKNDARAWLGRAKAQRLMDKWGASIQSIDQFLALMPDSREGLLFKAEMLLEKDKSQEAERAFAKYLDLEPGDSRAWCSRGISLQSLGLSADAVKSFKKCLELDPGHEKALQWLKIIEGGGKTG